MATKTTSLVALFDDIVASSNILAAGSEGMFAQFVSSQMGVNSQLQEIATESANLKSKNAATEIKLKHAQLKLKDEIAKRTEQEDVMQHYVKQFTIIHEVLGDTKLNELSERERRSLAFLKEATRKSCGGTPLKNVSTSVIDSSVTLSPSEVDPDATDVDVSVLRSGTKWIRTLNQSTESRKRNSDGEGDELKAKKRFRASLSPTPDVECVPRLDHEFRRPPPPHQHKRRKPSRGHLQSLATGSGITTTTPMEIGPVSSDDGMIPQSISPSPLPSPSPTPPPLPLRTFPLSQPSESEIDSDGPVPSAPPLTPHMYPSLPSKSSSENTPKKEDSGDNSNSEQPPTVPTRPPPSPTAFTQATQANVQRNHTFFTKTLMRIETCQVCNKKIRFGRNCLKCRDCRSLCHPECKAKVPLPCIPSVPTPKKMQDAGLSSFCPNTIPRVPAILVHCISEIERRGLTAVGLYRVPGSEKVKKELKERLLKVRGQAALDKVNDVNVICGVVKDFLTHLREPILTFRLHNTFMTAIDSGSDEDVLAGLLEAIAELPPCNKDTLAYIILHIQKVASLSEANKMPLESLAKIFGPTLVGHATAKPDPSVQWKDADKQPKVVQRLLNITPDYWRQYLSPMENPEPVASPNIRSTQTSPAGFTSPATPEQRPVPESPFLGSCHQSPRTHRAAVNRAGLLNTPGLSQRRNGNFFPSLN